MLHNYTQSSARWLTVLFPVTLILGHVAADVTLSLIAALFLLHSALQKQWVWCEKAWIRVLALLWCYMIVRGVLAEHPLAALRRALPFARYFLFAAALAYWTLSVPDTRQKFLTVLTAVVIFLTLDGLLQRVWGHDIIGRPLHLDHSNYIRLTGPFSHEMLGIMLMWFSFPVCMRFILTESGTFQRPVRLYSAIAGVSLVLVTIMLSGERMALLLAFFGWTIALWLLPVKRSTLLIMIAVGLALLEMLAYMSPEVFDRQIYSTLYTFEHWQQSPYGLLLTSDSRIAETNPLFGIGTNHFHDACEMLYPGVSQYELNSACNTHPHNVYMEFLIENGIIGLLLYLCFIAIVISECAKVWPQLRTNPVCIGIIIMLIVHAWPIAPSTSFFSPWGAPPFWLMLGWLLAYTEPLHAHHTD